MSMGSHLTGRCGGSLMFVECAKKSRQKFVMVSTILHVAHIHCSTCVVIIYVMHAVSHDRHVKKRMHNRDYILSLI